MSSTKQLHEHIKAENGHDSITVMSTERLYSPRYGTIAKVVYAAGNDSTIHSIRLTQHQYYTLTGKLI